MKERIHDLRAEIKIIEEMLDTLSGPMHELALEEQRNLQFELDTLERTAIHQSFTLLPIAANQNPVILPE